MRLAKGWGWFVAPLLALAAVFFLAGFADASFVIVGAASLVLVAFVAWFFRDPERATGPGIVAAADGRVQHVTEDGIVTFLNVHDVHVVRAPYEGRVVRVERFDGPHRPAFLADAEKNAGVRVVLETEWGEQTVRLVAGLVARRAVTWVTEGQSVAKGERIGMIRFSSRVDITLPPRVDAMVRVGDRVKAGTTTVANDPGEEDA